jgi:hypothetical protein
MRRGEGSFDAVRADLQEICSIGVDPDGIIFDAESIPIESIRAEDEYAGMRARIDAHCGSARLRLQIDIGLGDSMWPAPDLCAYPALLEFPAPQILAYRPETVVAEKLEALVVLGDRNSRIKDYFDLHHLASRFAFDRTTLVEAVRRTFLRRETPTPSHAPIGLTPDYWANPSRPSQVQAFARRTRLEAPSNMGREIGAMVADFLLPVLDDLRGGRPTSALWQPGGPWRAGTDLEQEP